MYFGKKPFGKRSIPRGRWKNKIKNYLWKEVVRMGD
jgi:hypothetical protein